MFKYFLNLMDFDYFGVCYKMDAKSQMILEINSNKSKKLTLNKLNK